MKKKTKILLTSYILAALIALGVYAGAGRADLFDARQAAAYSANRAFEETVRSVDSLSRALAKSVYATDGSMCSRICGEAYADALAAESALSTLPFSTQELEQISAFLNVAGDYAYTLCGEAAAEGFTQEQLETLTQLSDTAAGLADRLWTLRGSVNDGAVVMDSRETRLQNVPPQENTEKLSARMLDAEAEFTPLAALSYDGKYGAAEKTTRGYLSEEEMLTQAAQFAGVEPGALQEVYRYEGTEGRRCFRTGDTYLCVSRAGVESLAQTRLVSEAKLSEEEAIQRAKTFLQERGYADLELTEHRVNGAVAALRFAKTEDGAVCLDNCVDIAVALDDGAVYSFNACNYNPDTVGADWAIDEEEAARTLPENLTLNGSRRVILQSDGKRNLACYEFSCADGDRPVTIYVNAATGRQSRIVIGEAETK